MGEVDGLERRRVAEPGRAEAPLELALPAGRPLGVDEQAETVLEAEPGGAIDGPPTPVPPEVVTRDEAFYDEMRSPSGFVQQFPIERAPATERTDVWVFYDDENVYVAARCWDSAPEDQWIADEMQRDSFQLIQNDRIVVAFDPFYDRRNGMAFMVNPIGGFFDFEISDEGNPNNDWNPVWDVRTSRFEGGWSVEMQIPFKSLRFQQGRSQLWGIQFERQVRRKDEVSHLTPVPIAVGPGILRLSGKVGNSSIGALNMQTDDAPDANALATNFTVVRVKQDILRRSRIGAIFTRRSVSLDRNGENDVYGADASFSFHDNMTFNGYYARTRTYGRVGDDASYQGQFTYDADLFGLQAEHLLVGKKLQPGTGLPAAPGLHALVRDSQLPPAARDRRHTPVHVRRHPRLHRERQARSRDPRHRRQVRYRVRE